MITMAVAPRKMPSPKRSHPKATFDQTWMILFVIMMFIQFVHSHSEPQFSLAPILLNANEKCMNTQKYRPEGPVGIRFKKQILVPRDMTSGTFDSHMLESSIRRKHFHYMFDLDDPGQYEEDFQLQQLCPTLMESEGLAFLLQQDDYISKPSTETIPTFCAVNQLQGGTTTTPLLMPPATFMSTHFYKPKYSHIQGGATNTQKNSESIANGGIQIQVQGGEQLTDILRDNHYLNLALGVKPYYELPTNVGDCMDQEQTIEGFLFKKAKTNNINNYQILKAAIESGNNEVRDHKIITQDVFMRYSFTYEEPEYIGNLTTGMKPNQIQKLKPQSSTLRFFTQDIELSPQKLTFDECQLLIPKFETLKISNKQRKKDLVIRAIVASTPELSFYTSSGPYHDQAIRVRPGDSVEIKVAFTSETLGLFEALMYIVLDEWVYVASLNAFVVPNAYDIQPFYVTDVNVNQTVELPLFITNPSTTDTMIIEELFSTEEDVKLKWPHNKEDMSEKFDSLEGGASPVQYILIPEGSRKQIANMVFESNRTLDFIVEIHIRTSLHDIIRVPLYYHVHQDFIKFSPNVLDFGLAPLNFDILKIPMYAKSKLSEPLVISDILLPLGDKRLDFQLVDLGRNNLIRKNREVFIGYALLNPNEKGVVETKLTILCQGQKSNHSYTLDVPIIGRVHSQVNLLGNFPVNQNTQFSPPLVNFDLSKHLNETTGSRRKINEPPILKSDILTSPLVLKNNFNLPILIKGLVNQNPEIKISNIKGEEPFTGKPLILQPGASVEYAKIALNTELLKISQGNKYLSVQVNNTLIPIAISLYDRSLLCSWDDQEHLINLENIPLCTTSSPQELNFDYVAINDVKQRKMKITNLNSVNITIETVAKQQLDDLNIFIEQVIDRSGQSLTVNEIDSIQPIIGPKRTKRVINFSIQPYQTLQLVFQVFAREPKQKFSRIDFQVKDGDSQSFQFNYKYHVISGQLTFVPQIIQFNPSYPGMTQQRALIARSTFEVPITVKAIISNDIRIMPYLQPLVIRPNNKTEFGSLTFDPSKQAMNVQNLANKNFDISSIFNQPLLNIDPLLQQNILQIINGLQGGIQPMLTMSKGIGIQAIMTPHDLEGFRDKQRLWTQQGVNRENGEITTLITIETNVYANLTVPVRAQLKKPALTEAKLTQDQVWAEVIDFDTVQFGSMQAQNVKIVNPTDEPLVVALFITTNEAYERLMNLSMKEDQSQEKVSQPSDKDYFFKMYCAPKLKDKKPLDFKKVPDLHITLSQKENQLSLCQKLSKIMYQISVSPTDEADVLRRRIEGYFKDNYLADIQREFNQAQMTQSQSKAQKHHNPGNQLNFHFSSGQSQQKGWHQFDAELENITNLINQHSHSRPIDLQTLNLLKINYQRQKEILEQHTQPIQKKGWLSSLIPDISGMHDTLYTVLKAIMVGRQPVQRMPNNSTSVRASGEKFKRELKYREPKGSVFRLKNHLMNDILVYNETSKLYQDKIVISDPMIVTYTGQSFFINPSVQGQVYKVEPRSNLTIKDAVIFQPQSIMEPISSMKLLLKNNLTLIHAVDLKGSGGTGVLEVSRILKKSVNHKIDHFVNAPTLSGYIYGPHMYQQSGDQQPDYMILSQSTLQNRQLVNERVIGNIFGHKEREGTSPGHREVLMRANYQQRMSSASYIDQVSQEPGVIPFHITQDDIFIPVTAQVQVEESVKESQSETDYDYIEDHESMLVNRILENAANKHNLQEVYSKYQQKQIKVQTYHKRVLVIQNTGNLPVNVESVRLEDGTCRSQRFIIENCQPFTLQPGEQHWLHIGYQNDFTFAKIKRKLILESKQGVLQEYHIELQLPVDYLQVANDLLPLTRFEEWQQIFLKLLLLSAAFASLSYVAKDSFHHIKFISQTIPDSEERLTHFEDLFPSHSPLPVSQAFKQGSMVTDKRELIAPVLRDYIVNDQVFVLYQQAQDKLLDRSGVGRSQQTSQQLLLKEVGNICSNKKSSVCLEAQKQAIDAEKEARRLASQRHVGYALQQHMEREQIKALREAQIEQEEKLKRAEAAKKAQEAIVKKPVKGESKDNSIFSDISINDAPLPRGEDEDMKEGKVKQQQQAAPALPKALKLTKKQQQRLKEQKEAEENFKKLECERQKREKEEEVLREVRRIEQAKRDEQQRLKDIERAAIEEAKRAQQLLLQKAKQPLTKVTPTARVIPQRQIEITSAPPSESQSVVYDHDTQSPLNISAFNPQTTTSQNLNDQKNQGKFNFEQQSADKHYQISGVSQIDKKDHHHEAIGEVGEDSSDFLDHILQDKQRQQSLRSQNRPVFERYFLDQHSSGQQTSEKQNTFSQQQRKEEEDSQSQQESEDNKASGAPIDHSYDFIETGSKKRTPIKSKAKLSETSSSQVKKEPTKKESAKGVYRAQFINQSSNEEPMETAKTVSTGVKLTKDDLLPFFESQKIVDIKEDNTSSKRERQKSESQQPQPSPGSYLGASIFSYNPLSLFTGNHNQQDQTSQKSEIHSPQPQKGQPNQLHDDEYLPTDFGQIKDTSSQLGSEEDEPEDQQEYEQESTNLYNVFQRASTIFSKPLFNYPKANAKPTTALYQQVPSNAASYFNQPNFSSLNRVANTLSGEHERSFIQEEIDEEQKNPGGFSIFSQGPQFQDNEGATAEEKKVEKESVFGGSLFSEGPKVNLQPSQFIKAQQYQPPVQKPDQWLIAQKREEYFGRGGNMGQFQDQYQQQQSAYRRNQQSLYTTTYPNQQAGFVQQPYQYPPPPPPGLGFVPQHQSLYSQYSQGNLGGGFGAPPGLSQSDRGAAYNQFSSMKQQQAPPTHSVFSSQGSMKANVFPPRENTSGQLFSQHNMSGSGSFNANSTVFEHQQHFATPTPNNPWSAVQNPSQQQIGALIGASYQRTKHHKNSSSFVKLEDEESEGESQNNIDKEY